MTFRFPFMPTKYVKIIIKIKPFGNSHAQICRIKHVVVRILGTILDDIKSHIVGKLKILFKFKLVCVLKKVTISDEA